MHLWIGVLFSCLIVMACAAPVSKQVLDELKELLEEKPSRRTRQIDDIITDVYDQRRAINDKDRGGKQPVKQGDGGSVIDQGWSQEEVEALLKRLSPADVRTIVEFKKLADRLNTARRLVALSQQLKQQQRSRRGRGQPVGIVDVHETASRDQDMHSSGKDKQLAETQLINLLSKKKDSSKQYAETNRTSDKDKEFEAALLAALEMLQRKS